MQENGKMIGKWQISGKTNANQANANAKRKSCPQQRQIANLTRKR